MPSARVTVAALITAAALTACSDDGADTASNTPETSDLATASSSSSSSPGTAPTSTPSDTSDSPEEPADPTVEVRINGDQVSPNAQEVSLAVGEALVFDIDSDRAGKLHVHSKPEQYVEFNEGSTRVEITVETPVSVEVEDHETSAVVAILEVR